MVRLGTQISNMRKKSNTVERKSEPSPEYGGDGELLNVPLGWS